MAKHKFYPCGFTLLELIVVIIIVGVLAGLAIPRFFRIIERSRAVEAVANLGVIRRAVEMCYVQRGAYDQCVSDDGANMDLNWSVLALDDLNNIPGGKFKYEGFCNPILSSNSYVLIATLKDEAAYPDIPVDVMDCTGLGYGHNKPFLMLCQGNAGNVVWIKGQGIYDGNW